MIDRNEFNRIYYLELNSMKVTASLLGVTVKQLTTYMEENNLKCSEMPEIDMKVFKDYYYKQKLTAMEVGVIIGCRGRAINDYMRKHNLPRRSASETATQRVSLGKIKTPYVSRKAYEAHQEAKKIRAVAKKLVSMSS